VCVCTVDAEGYLRRRGKPYRSARRYASPKAYR
jgi:hypothetical protein